MLDSKLYQSQSLFYGVQYNEYMSKFRNATCHSLSCFYNLLVYCVPEGLLYEYAKHWIDQTTAVWTLNETDIGK